MAEAIIYADEKEMGRAEEEEFVRPEVKRPQRSLVLPGAVTYLFSRLFVRLKVLNYP